MPLFLDIKGFFCIQVKRKFRIGVICIFESMQLYGLIKILLYCRCSQIVRLNRPWLNYKL